MEFIILIAVFGLMMWMMSRGARKQRQAAADLRSSLEVGQQVMTASGFYGTIVDIDGDVITLESTPGNETMWKRDAVSAVTEPPFAVDEEDDDETDTDDEVTGVAVPDDASSLTQTAETQTAEAQADDPVETATDEQADHDENDDRRA